MARKQNGKPTGKVEKEKLQLTLDPEVAHKLRCAALGHKMDLSEFVTQWVNKEFSGVHIRGLEKSNEPSSAIGQGGGSPSHVVVIKSAVDRIGEISRRSGAPVDRAVDDLVNG